MEKKLPLLQYQRPPYQPQFMMNEPVITVSGLSKKYFIGNENYHLAERSIAKMILWPYRKLRGIPEPSSNRRKREVIWALKDINFDIYHGDKVGIIGKNGAGKSTLLKILSRLVYPTEGEARIRGRVTSLLEVGTGFNNNLSGRENVYLNASLHGLQRREIEEIFDDIVEFSEVKKFIDTPVKHYSSGMRMRLAFAVAAHLDPDILLLDEVLAVGDMSFQQKCLKRVQGLTSEGRTILFVSHSMDAVARFCDRCIWLEQGKVVQDGAAEEVIAAYVQKVMGVVSKKQGVEAQKTETHPPKKPASESTTFSQSENNKKQASESKISSDSITNNGARLTTEGDEGLTSEASTTLKTEGEIKAQNPCVRLVKAQIVNEDRKPVSVIRMNTPVGIQMTYDILLRDKLLVPAIALMTLDEKVVFWAVDADVGSIEKRKAVGQHTSIAWLPRDFLNEGQYFVTLAIVSPDTTPLESHFVIDKALSFYSAETKEHEKNSRGMMSRNFPGYLRPKLNWEIYCEENICKPQPIDSF